MFELEEKHRRDMLIVHKHLGVLLEEKEQAMVIIRKR